MMVLMKNLFPQIMDLGIARFVFGLGLFIIDLTKILYLWQNLEFLANLQGLVPSYFIENGDYYTYLYAQNLNPLVVNGQLETY